LNRFDQNFEWTNEKEPAVRICSIGDGWDAARDAADGFKPTFSAASIVSAGIALMLP